MGKERRELYIEGVAIHGGPESCAGVREGVGEALAGVRVGWAIEPRNQRSGVPTPYNWVEGNIVGRAFASGWRTPRGLRTCACAESPCARTGRFRACTGSQPARGPPTTRESAADDVAFHPVVRRRHPGTLISRLNSPAYAYPCQRFTDALTNASA